MLNWNGTNDIHVIANLSVLFWKITKYFFYLLYLAFFQTANDQIIDINSPLVSQKYLADCSHQEWIYLYFSLKISKVSAHWMDLLEYNFYSLTGHPFSLQDLISFSPIKLDSPSPSVPYFPNKRALNNSCNEKKNFLELLLNYSLTIKQIQWVLIICFALFSTLKRKGKMSLTKILFQKNNRSNTN